MKESAAFVYMTDRRRARKHTKMAVSFAFLVFCTCTHKFYKNAKCDFACVKCNANLEIAILEREGVSSFFQSILIFCFFDRGETFKIF